MKDTYTVLIVDDHQLIVDGIKFLLSSESSLNIIASASDIDSAKQGLEIHYPDIMITDIELKNSNGFTLIEYCQECFPNTQVIVLTLYANIEYIEKAVQLGVKSFIPKKLEPEVLLTAIKKVIHGGSFFPDDITNELYLTMKDGKYNRIQSLTHREKMIVQYLAKLMNTKDISVILNISISTIQTFYDRIEKKLGLKSLSELRQFALNHKALFQENDK